MAVLPSPFPEPTWAAVPLCCKVCWASSEERDVLHQSSLRESEASHPHNCKGNLLQVSVLICKLSLSKIHTWCQGIGWKSTRRHPAQICVCTVKWDRLANQEAKGWWGGQAGSLPWWAGTVGTSKPPRPWIWTLHSTPPRRPEESTERRMEVFNLPGLCRRLRHSSQFAIRKALFNHGGIK